MNKVYEVLFIEKDKKTGNIEPCLLGPPICVVAKNEKMASVEASFQMDLSTDEDKDVDVLVRPFI